MTKFKYTAREKNGKDITGFRDAEDRYALARALRGEGILLLTVEDVTARSSPISKNFQSFQ